jgi:hypothetical protein
MVGAPNRFVLRLSLLNDFQFLLFMNMLGSDYCIVKGFGTVQAHALLNKLAVVAADLARDPEAALKAVFLHAQPRFHGVWKEVLAGALTFLLQPVACLPTRAAGSPPFQNLPFDQKALDEGCLVVKPFFSVLMEHAHPAYVAHFPPEAALLALLPTIAPLLSEAIIKLAGKPHRQEADSYTHFGETLGCPQWSPASASLDLGAAAPHVPLEEHVQSRARFQETCKFSDAVARSLLPNITKECITTFLASGGPVISPELFMEKTLPEAIDRLRHDFIIDANYSWNYPGDPDLRLITAAVPLSLDKARARNSTLPSITLRTKMSHGLLVVDEILQAWCPGCVLESSHTCRHIAAVLALLWVSQSRCATSTTLASTWAGPAASLRSERDLTALHKPVAHLRHRTLSLAGFDETAGISFSQFNDAYMTRIESREAKKEQEWGIRLAGLAKDAGSDAFTKQLGTRLMEMDHTIAKEQERSKRKSVAQTTKRNLVKQALTRKFAANTAEPPQPPEPPA